jgi:IS5 family transposase
MEQVLPRDTLLALLGAVYPKAGKARYPYPKTTMLCIPLLWSWCSNSDQAIEKEVYEVAPLRRFAVLSLARGSLPDETRILNYRSLLESHSLAPTYWRRSARI